MNELLVATNPDLDSRLGLWVPRTVTRPLTKGVQGQRTDLAVTVHSPQHDLRKEPPEWVVRMASRRRKTSSSAAPATKASTTAEALHGRHDEHWRATRRPPTSPHGGFGKRSRKRAGRKTGTAPRTDLTTPTAHTDRSISTRPQDYTSPQTSATVRPLRRDRLGGLLHEYLQVA